MRVNSVDSYQSQAAYLARQPGARAGGRAAPTTAYPCVASTFSDRRMPITVGTYAACSIAAKVLSLFLTSPTWAIHETGFFIGRPQGWQHVQCSACGMGQVPFNRWCLNESNRTSSIIPWLVLDSWRTLYSAGFLRRLRKLAVWVVGERTPKKW